LGTLQSRRPGLETSHGIRLHVALIFQHMLWLFLNNCVVSTDVHPMCTWCTHAVGKNVSSRHDRKTALHSSRRNMYCQCEHLACCPLDSPLQHYCICEGIVTISITKRCSGMMMDNHVTLSVAGTTSATSASALPSVLLCRPAVNLERPCLNWHFNRTCNLMCPSRHQTSYSLRKDGPYWR
jgi:hypothetical protein